MNHFVDYGPSPNSLGLRLCHDKDKENDRQAGLNLLCRLTKSCVQGVADVIFGAALSASLSSALDPGPQIRDVWSQDAVGYMIAMTQAPPKIAIFHAHRS